MSIGEHLAYAWCSLLFVALLASMAVLSYRDGVYFATIVCGAVLPVAVGVSYRMCRDLYDAIKALKR